MIRICIVPYITSMGGVGSFRLKFEAGLRARGVEVTHDLGDPLVDVILILAGTKNLVGLWRAKRRGVPIIQRLDGINWLQRKRWTGARYHLRAEYGNALLAFTRRFLADGIVYQSAFTRNWWESWFGKTRVPSRIIHNGVDLAVYSPDGGAERPVNRYRLVVVEGSLTGGLDFGLDWALQLMENLSARVDVELLVVGDVTQRKQAEVGARFGDAVKFAGVVPRERIPQINRSAHLFFSAEINPACPNAVIEALACGTPVLGFDSGALNELVPARAGKVVPYGGSPWELDVPDIPALTES
ncbi:MAG: glycosyltransferase family 4 protein, partial [Anaerolineales bacterium]|nr:glycosyltransferase family 4 protein [Anaerolineales bacterium]